jgi:hemoglobin-like flavoprotein
MSREVGFSIKISDEQAAAIANAEAKLTSIHRDLGMAREQYVVIENQILQAMSEARTALQDTVNGIGKAHDISVGPEATEKWRYDVADKTFVRVA